MEGKMKTNYTPCLHQLPCFDTHLYFHQGLQHKIAKEKNGRKPHYSCFSTQCNTITKMD